MSFWGKEKIEPFVWRRQSDFGGQFSRRQRRRRQQLGGPLNVALLSQSSSLLVSQSRAQRQRLQSQRTTERVNHSLHCHCPVSSSNSPDNYSTPQQLRQHPLESLPLPPLHGAYLYFALGPNNRTKFALRRQRAEHGRHSGEIIKILALSKFALERLASGPFGASKPTSQVNHLAMPLLLRAAITLLLWPRAHSNGVVLGRPASGPAKRLRGLGGGWR